MRRAARVAIWTVISTITMVGAAELMARSVLGLKTLNYTRPYHPIFVSGDQLRDGVTQTELIKAPGGPEAYGYVDSSLGPFFWSGRNIPHSSTDLSDFLFSNYLSQYDHAEVDDVVCRRVDASIVYVLGGSVAVGSSASSKKSSWHALLESRLRESLARRDIFVVNAAMGGFTSTQEKLAYYMAAVPRGARHILILNGYNDLTLFANSGGRPGIPFQTGLRYSQIYGNGLSLWLAEHSALWNQLVQHITSSAVLALRNKISTDGLTFKRHVDAFTTIYLENMSAVLADCEAFRRTCFVALQPFRAFSELQLGEPPIPYREVLPAEQLKQAYEILWKRISSSRYARHFIDLSRVITSKAELAYYTDTVHLDDRGQILLAQAVLPYILEGLRSEDRALMPERIISCNSARTTEISEIDLSRLKEANLGKITLEGSAARLIADSRQWVYSAFILVGLKEDISQPLTSLRIELGAVKGEIGVGALADFAATSFLIEKRVEAGDDGTIVHIPLRDGTKQITLVFRKQAGDGEASDVEIRRITMHRADGPN
jgi:lysophospholipase L1-like esterase